MLITFQTDAYESITFFGHVAQRLLQYMGQSGRVPGAIVADDVPQALRLLSQALEHDAQQVKALGQSDIDEEPEIRIVQRAVPLVALLQAAIDKRCDVLWSERVDF